MFLQQICYCSVLKELSDGHGVSSQAAVEPSQLPLISASANGAPVALARDVEAAQAELRGNHWTSKEKMKNNESTVLNQKKNVLLSFNHFLRSSNPFIL